MLVYPQNPLSSPSSSPTPNSQIPTPQPHPKPPPSPTHPLPLRSALETSPSLFPPASPNHQRQTERHIVQPNIFLSFSFFLFVYVCDFPRIAWDGITTITSPFPPLPKNLESKRVACLGYQSIPCHPIPSRGRKKKNNAKRREVPRGERKEKKEKKMERRIEGKWERCMEWMNS